MTTIARDTTGLAVKTRSAMERLLRPTAIAIVGASPEPKALSRWILNNINMFDYTGELHLVSRSRTEIEGRPCVPNIDALPYGIDVALLSIPEAGVLEAVHACGRRGIGTVIIFSSGFAETGEEGRQKQNVIAEAAREAGVLLVGPNCLGLTNFLDGIPLAMDPLIHHVPDEDACIAIIAQSGATANNMRDAFIGRRLSLAFAISTGNEANLGIEDFLEAMIAEARVRIIAIYAEQVRNPQRFLMLARRAREAGKPIVFLMPGRSARAREAAQSHTGALTGDRAVAKVLLDQEGVAFVDTLDELFDVTAVLLRYPNPPAAGPAFMTNSGAMKNLALDLADEVGLPFPPITEATADAINAQLPDFADAENPLDYTTMGGSNPGAIGDFARLMLNDANTGGLIISVMGGPKPLQMDKAQHMLPALVDAPKPVAFVIMGDEVPLAPEFLDAVKAAKVPFFRSPDRALRAFACVRARGAALARLQSASHAPEPAVSLNRRGNVAEYDGKVWLRDLGLQVPKGDLARTADEAVEIARRVGFPVVAKAQHRDLLHKSDVGGVMVGLADETAVRDAFAAILRNVGVHRPDLQLDGVLIEDMAPKGLELVVGAKRDKDWGPVVVVGLGGIWIEALHDVRILAANASQGVIREELEKLKAAVMLHGIRGARAIDIDEVARVASRLGGAMIDNPDILEIDINPLVAYPDRVVALDALIIANP